MRSKADEAFVIVETSLYPLKLAVFLKNLMNLINKVMRILKKYFKVLFMHLQRLSTFLPFVQLKRLILSLLEEQVVLGQNTGGADEGDIA